MWLFEALTGSLFDWVLHFNWNNVSSLNIFSPATRSDSLRCLGQTGLVPDESLHWNSDWRRAGRGAQHRRRTGWCWQFYHEITACSPHSSQHPPATHPTRSPQPRAQLLYSHQGLLNSREGVRGMSVWLTEISQQSTDYWLLFKRYLGLTITTKTLRALCHTPTTWSYPGKSYLIALTGPWNRWDLFRISEVMFLALCNMK